jgi:hypothetical protein
MSTVVLGSAALFPAHHLLSPISADRLAALLGPGEYTLTGDVWSGDGDVPVDGSCHYQRDGGHVLEVSVGSRDLPFNRYGDARARQENDPRAVAIDGDDGYTMTEDVTSPDGVVVAQRSVAVVFRGDTLVTVNVLVPAPGVDTALEIVPAVQEAATALARPLDVVA